MSGVTGAQVQSFEASWQRLLDRLGEPSRQRDYAERQAPEPGRPDRRQVDIAELFVRADTEQRRSHDVLALVRLEHEGEGPDRHELVVLGPETIRNQASPAPTGIRARHLRLSEPGDRIRALSVVVVRAARRPRVVDVVRSLTELGRCLDHRNDPGGSDAVADAVIARLEALLAMPPDDVVVPVVGVVDPVSMAARAGESHHLLLARGAPALLEADLDVRDGQVVTARPPLGSESSGKPGGDDKEWPDQDFVLVRIGPPPERTVVPRDIQALRLEQALYQAGVEADTAVESSERESWTSRVTRARATVDAQRMVRLAVGGDTAAAQATLDAAMRQISGGAQSTPVPTEALTQALAERIHTVREFWLVEEVVRGRLPGAMDTPGALTDRLGDLLGIRAGPPGDLDRIPVVTPFVMEIGDALVPYVDRRQDGGLFLDTTIVEMRERVRRTTGVRVPGLRARGTTLGSPDSLVIQVDEVPVRSRAVPLDRPYLVRRSPGGPPPDGTGVTLVHPQTGEVGIWFVDSTAGSSDADQLNPAEMLIFELEAVVLRHLVNYLGVQELAALLDEAETEQELVSSRVSSPRDLARLTGVLQALVRDRVPIVDLRSILDAVEEAGGLEAPLPRLRRAARAAVRDHLPGTLPGEPVVAVPEEFAAALEAPGEDRPWAPARTRLPVRAWLREVVAERGPVVTLVTTGQTAREGLAALVRAEHPLVTPLAAEEVRGS